MSKCRNNSGLCRNSILFQCFCSAVSAKILCENGEMVMRKQWLEFAISVEIHCVTAVAWCVSGVSNPDFTNFTKHSTVLTSILQQISILYQHFQSAETAIPALEQAKTMLKIVLPTFKNDENHTQNSVCEVRCGECCGGFLHFCCQDGENAVRKRRNGVALQRVDALFTAFWFQKKWRKRMRLRRLLC